MPIKDGDGFNMLFRAPKRLVNIDHYRRFNEFENVGNQGRSKKRPQPGEAEAAN